MGGVIQTTPYIGQPAYKKMGGRAAYTLMICACSSETVGVFGDVCVYHLFASGCTLSRFWCSSGW
jgi:AGZA family xanthine/uracil permease-like MFS transporter